MYDPVLIIREKVREMDDREKRKSLMVVNYLEVPSGREFVEVFEDVWKHILGPDKVFYLSEIVCISRDNKLYRVKIENVDIRIFLISSSRRLKDFGALNYLIQGCFNQ